MSFLIWNGNKRSLIKQIIPLMKKYETKYCDYYEPFLGSGSVLEENLFSNYYASDINSQLINCHKCIKDNSENLLKKLKSLSYDTSKEAFNFRLQLFNKMKRLNIHNVDTAALFIYINRTAYRGFYSEDAEGNVKTSYGYHKNKIYDAEKITYMSYLYNKHNVVFSTRSYDEINYSDNAFIYLDPHTTLLSTCMIKVDSIMKSLENFWTR